MTTEAATQLPPAADPPRTILVSGASGLIGSRLSAALRAAGHRVVPLTRTRPAPGGDAVYWNPAEGEIEAAALEGFDVVVHLAGENIASGRWTEARKERIRNSRVGGTQLLSDALTKLQRPPSVLINASALGYYGDRGDTVLDESSPAGEGFLAEVCQAWEQAAEVATARGIRVARTRLGIVLSPKGGALSRMLTPFRLGLGGRLGDGRQYMSWIDLDDVVGALHHVMVTPGLSGPVNVVAPEPVTNREFTKTLGRVLRRPTILPAPAFALRAAMGEMADALLLASARIEPRRLLESGYMFQYPQLEAALRHQL